MKKRIDCAELRLGMYVAELDRPWLETPFLFQGFEITSEEELEDLKRYCKYVYIETERTDPAALATLKKPEQGLQSSGYRAVTDGVNPKELELEMLKQYRAPRQRSIYSDQTTVEAEVEAIKATHEQANVLIDSIMEDARLGRSINTAPAKQLVGKMAQSVIRNPDALVCFSQLKHKDRYTAEHSLRVCILALAFGRHLGLERDQLEILGLGALLHDIGKMKVPNSILNKPAELTLKEVQIMEQHVPEGVKLLQQTNIPAPALQVVSNHHEHYDGTGYINGLKGDIIGQFGLIGAIVDFYDAMTSDRAYRDALPSHTILKEIYKTRGKSFSPALVEQFIQCMGIYPIGSVVELNTGDVGVVMNINRIHRLKPKVALVLQPDNRPHRTRKTVDLVEDRTSTSSRYEIATVTEPRKYDIDPVDHLPVPKVS